ncbi:hypothetical protein PILCRDRAFT_690165 [Piloderma croceum F 1598]|uniref:Uncharacterized protein n=1 Tax=Piloderma croceum (strain F 1598) TaxID=765440 RepID=A0A0C3ER12_PILCF|nr:hypothetical protein PILCRDRAFT_690165 [Piloderma croceum F 1598]
MAAQLQSKAFTPPPAYSEDQPFFAPLPSPPSHSHTLFGPTPISQQQGLLIPYYDQHSPYAIEQAASRARWRFFGGILWAVGIFGIVSVIDELESHFGLSTRRNLTASSS